MNMAVSAAPVGGIQINGAINEGFDEILTPQALEFLAELQSKFGARREALLNEREARQLRISNGERPDFLAETKDIREGDWKVAPIPEDLLDRRVEITGPAEPKMIINALNSGAQAFMADLEDALSPTWERVIEGQLALRDAVRRELKFTSPEGKAYAMDADSKTTLIVRPRGWHLEEKHLTYEGKPMSGSLVDFGLYFFHNAAERVKRGTGPYYYIPKLESHHEAALWNDVFAYAEERLNIPHGSIKATVLIEVITAVFEMHEILHAMKDYIVGLNCGRWDYIFSFIKKFHQDPAFMLPDRSQVGMGVHFLKSYSELLIKTCHKRGAFAMGGMAAAIPNRKDEEANAKAFASVKADKEREAGNGHDGTWVAHPDLIPVALEAFDSVLGGKKNQLDVAREEVDATADDLLKVPEGTITEAGVRMNINVGIQYTAAWLDGRGAVPIFNLMEDAATAEISRTQLWQWAHHDDAVMDNGTEVTLDLVKSWIPEELEKIKAQYGEAAFDASKCKEAASLFEKLTSDDHFAEFLTLPAYEQLA